ncbi:3-phosphoshikimate 1-carboxyvinyltransferase [Lapidilactobacillus achengensis]|uniref:3-phosphoshikimate 1-carboxyvinyltransferase n=1 Tax=Lapidilactobacillus achengensis TaxID=2486000 RepID=A0ABW1UMX4_9LACO|nr:3-phosphoshikimate 1-carboxyvinyltransferase [Lapidilactobacillus achengensis]
MTPTTLFTTEFDPTIDAGLQGNYQTPGDKSISHRALLLGALAQGTTVIHGLLPAADIRSTQQALQSLGVKLITRDHTTEVIGQGGWQFQPTAEAVSLDLGNSGTTTRLLLGLLARQRFTSHLQGDASLSQRPLRDIIEPLSEMGAKFTTETATLPLMIAPNQWLNGLRYRLPVASAQLKSALILAALQADQPSVFWELAPTRDHTERLLQLFGAQVTATAGKIQVTPQRQPLQAQELTIPGDPSSAAFMICAALFRPHSRLTITNHSLNPTRTGLLRLLQALGAPITILPSSQTKTVEPAADLLVETWTQPTGTIQIDQHNLGGVIDEVPLLALLATQLPGTSVITDAATLRHKETDRLAVITEQLRLFGARIDENPTGLVIHGGHALHAPTVATLNSHGDHRIAMTLVIAELLLQAKVPIAGLDSIAISNPTFLQDLVRALGGPA